MRQSPEAGSSKTAAAERTPAPWHSVPTAAARRFHQICFAKTSEVVGALGFTPLQYGAMVYLDRVRGTPGIEQNVLAARLNIDRNTASVVVEQLVKLGVVARQVNGADRRARLLSLTTKGEKLFSRLVPDFTAINADILAPLLPRERKQFMALLVRLIEGNLRDQERPARRRKQSNTDGTGGKS